MRLGILASHPIQYQAPWFRALAKETDLHVFFAHRQSAVEQGKAGFGVPFDWDVDLLSGYRHTFLSNVARVPGVNRFGGCDTPQIATEIERGRFDAFIVPGWYLKSYWQAIRACRRNRTPGAGARRFATPNAAITTEKGGQGTDASVSAPPIRQLSRSRATVAPISDPLRSDGGPDV